MVKYPDDWKVVPLGDVAAITRGGSPRPIQAWLTDSSDGLNWIKIGDVSVGAKYITSTEERIIPLGARYSREVKSGDFILSNSMSFGRPYILKIDGCIHDGWLAIQEYSKSYDTEYLYYILSSEDVFSQYVAMAAGSSVKNLNKDKVSDVKIPLPPLPEQKRIAAVLGNVDKLIDNLSRRIEKKRLVKQGVMQVLLTGKKRLPGFKGAWVEKRFDEFIVRFATGLNPRQNFRLNDGGSNFYVTIKDFREGRLYFDECDKVDDIALKMINDRSDLRRGDMLFSSIGRVGDAYVIKETPKNWNVNESVFVLRPDVTIMDVDFMYYLIKSERVQDKLTGGTTGSTLTGIKVGHLKEISCEFPSSLSEQKAIAKVLGDMDAEIAKLEAKYEKYRQLKQGLMNDLLTGKVRI